MLSAAHAVVQQWDLSIRLSLYLLGHAFLYIWIRYLVAPAKVGPARCLNALPVGPVLFFMTYLLREDRPEEYIALIYTSTNFCWLTPSKIFAFCFNRGQLMRSYDVGDDLAFALSLLFPITVEFKEKKVEANERTSGGVAYSDVQFSIARFESKDRILETLSVATRIISKLVVVLAVDIGTKRFEDWGWYYWRDVCMGCFMYASVSMVEDLIGLLLAIGWNIKSATNFDRPWMARSVTEFWSRRYNLVFARTLRDVTFDTVCSGKLILGDRYFDQSSPSPLKKMLAVMLTFSASGIFHMIVLWHIFGGRLPLLYGLFFFACGLVVVAENFIKSSLKQMGHYRTIVDKIPQWMYHVYVLGVIFTLSHYLFWPDMHRYTVSTKMIEGMTCFFLKS